MDNLEKKNSEVTVLTLKEAGEIFHIGQYTMNRIYKENFGNKKYPFCKKFGNKKMIIKEVFEDFLKHTATL